MTRKFYRLFGFVVEDGLVCRAEEMVGALRSLASLVELLADWVRGAPVGVVVGTFAGGVPQIGHTFAAVETWWPHLLQDTSGMPTSYRDHEPESRPGCEIEDRARVSRRLPVLTEHSESVY